MNSLNEKQYHLVKVIQKIEVFRGFEAQDVQQLLRICRFKNFSSGEHIYTQGEASDEMLIVLKGQLRVVGQAGEELAVIAAGMPIGEMGLFTGQPRSANIFASAPSTGIILRRAEVLRTLNANRDMHLKVLNNVIGTLSQRVADGNKLAESQARIIHDLQKKLDECAPIDEYEEDEQLPVDE
jgi:CRP-like cAMP-binding protein